ncbi:MAG TPA: hypothetical protein DD734_08160, partial [Firmicutes bacterium]|nr:hypothetical protein [Bacillota bacterium]
GLSGMAGTGPVAPVTDFAHLCPPGPDGERKEKGRKRGGKRMSWLKENGHRLKTAIIDYLIIFIGVNLTALGLVWFLIPNKIAAGGVSGLATVLAYLWGWPVGLVIILVNIPLFFACLFVFGPRFGMKTFFGTVLLAVVVEYWGQIVHPLTLDPLLGSLWGGVLSGVG